MRLAYRVLKHLEGFEQDESFLSTSPYGCWARKGEILISLNEHPRRALFSLCVHEGEQTLFRVDFVKSKKNEARMIAQVQAILKMVEEE